MSKTPLHGRLHTGLPTSEDRDRISGSSLCLQCLVMMSFPQEGCEVFVEGRQRPISIRKVQTKSFSLWRIHLLNTKHQPSNPGPPRLESSLQTTEAVLLHPHFLSGAPTCVHSLVNSAWEAESSLAPPVLTVPPPCPTCCSVQLDPLLCYFLHLPPPSIFQLVS